MTSVATRPTPTCRVWSRGKTIAEDLSGEDLSDVLELHADASAWWILPRDDYGYRELRDVARALDLDDLAVRDLLADDRRAKFESVGSARLVITNAVSVDQETAKVTTYPVSMIVTDRVLICVTADSRDFNPGKLLHDRDDLLTRGGVEAAIQLVVDAVISTYENCLQWLQDASDRLADSLFAERPLNKSEQLHAFRLRSALSQLRRITDPMRTVMTDIAENPPPLPRGGKNARDPQIARRWRLLGEKHQRVANGADALREALSAVFDTSLALADVRLNQIMKKLTGWAAILAVPTLVTSFVGMNVGFPWSGTVLGFWIYFMIMFVSGIALYLLFKARDWI